MQLFTNAYGYNFWIGIDERGEAFYNITLEGQPAPNGGYCSEWICGVKKVPNLFLNK
jgi:hypothetical protein